MWLLLCSSDDHPALWAAQRLRARGLAPLLVLTPELLHHSPRWEHRVGNDVPPSTAFTLADGREVRSEAIRGVLNRLVTLPSSLVDHLPPDDRAYTIQEWTALHISWLSSLQVPVLNRPVMQGLCGAFRQRSEWLSLAARAGFATRDFRHVAGCAGDLTPNRVRFPLFPRHVLVVDRQVIATGLTPALEQAALRLRELAGTRLLGIHVSIDTGLFVDASPRPDLRAGGEHLVDALYTALAGTGER